MRGIFSAAMGFMMFPNQVEAAGAAFAEDGKTVYAVEDNTIQAIRTDTGTVTALVVKEVDHPEAISRAGGGAFYLASEKTLWRWTPGGAAEVVHRGGQGPVLP
ncbi:MAG: hypothetical protein QM755_00480 [Luteolibacter sp.]